MSLRWFPHLSSFILEGSKVRLREGSEGPSRNQREHTSILAFTPGSGRAGVEDRTRAMVEAWLGPWSARMTLGSPRQHLANQYSLRLHSYQVWALGSRRRLLVKTVVNPQPRSLSNMWWSEMGGRWREACLCPILFYWGNRQPRPVTPAVFCVAMPFALNTPEWAESLSVFALTCHQRLLWPLWSLPWAQQSIQRPWSHVCAV